MRIVLVVHSSTRARWTRRLRCGRGCELFLNGSSKQVCLSALSFLGRTLDSAGLYQCISYGSWEVRTADNAWICDLLDRPDRARGE